MMECDRQAVGPAPRPQPLQRLVVLCRCAHLRLTPTDAFIIITTHIVGPARPPLRRLRAVRAR